MTTQETLKIGTRGSPLALAQAYETRDRLSKAHPSLSRDGAIEIVIINTTGDQIQDRPLAEVGGKGLFSKELDRALVAGEIDLAAHSMKDLETWMPEGIVIAATLEREDPRDALVSNGNKTLTELPAGSVIGSASLRRQAQLLNMRPDLKVVLIRGNVQTRLRKLKEGAVDATFLALAGLNRLNMADVVSEVIEPDVLLPAAAQGAIGITCRESDTRVAGLLEAINHPETATRITAERSMLAALDGSCQTPIGALATIEQDGQLLLKGLVAKADGTEVLTTERRGDAAAAEALGRDAGEELKRRADPSIFE